MKNISDLPYVYLNGPYKDLKTYGNPMCSMNAFLKINGTFRGKTTKIIYISFFFEALFNWSYRKNFLMTIPKVKIEENFDK